MLAPRLSLSALTLTLTCPANHGGVLAAGIVHAAVRQIVAAATEHEKARQSSAAHETAAANKADEVVAFAAGTAAGVTATIAADSGHPETPPEDPATPPLDD